MALFKTKKQAIPPKILHERFLAPPFSVFNTHQPYWKNRMLMWRDMGLCGTNGRAVGLAYDNRRMDKNGGRIEETVSGTSVFSPVLAEIVYKWFTVEGSNKVFDPFAGGITRGGMAAVLGHYYLGVDVNPKQVHSNMDERDKLLERYTMNGYCEWVCMDSSQYEDIGMKMKYDLVFTCPPYYNLETYTNDPEDLSNCKDYTEFLEKYTKILKMCYNVLEDNRFMVWVVSDVRDRKTTEYLGLVADTIKIAQNAGFKLYNEIILYNETGNLAIVSGDYMNRARKVGRQHQNVLVFYKGDTKEIGNIYKEVF